MSQLKCARLQLIHADATCALVFRPMDVDDELATASPCEMTVPGTAIGTARWAPSVAVDGTCALVPVGAGMVYVAWSVLGEAMVAKSPRPGPRDPPLCEVEWRVLGKATVCIRLGLPACRTAVAGAWA